MLLYQPSAFIILASLLWIKASLAYNIQRLTQRVDDLELKLLQEGQYRRTDLTELRDAIKKLEATLDGRLPQGLEAGKGTIVNDIKKIDSKEVLMEDSFRKFSVFSQHLKHLTKGFQNEKELNKRNRRHVAEIEKVLDSLEGITVVVSDELAKVLALIKNTETVTTENANDINEISGHANLIPSLMEGIENIKELINIHRQDLSRPKSCLELLKRGHVTSGLYKVYPGTWTQPVEVYCDQETEGGGWTVFQRREDGFVDFYRGWLDYKLGFGNLLGEFWLGNENIHQLTAVCCHELRVDLADFRENKKYAKYSKFQVGSKSGDYVLTAEGYSGDAGNALGGHSKASFSTKDHGKSDACSRSYKGGWWYTSCHSANLNGLYLHGNHTSYADGVEWRHWTGYHYSLKFTELKFRESETN